MSARVWLTSASRRSCSASGCSSCSCSCECSALLSACSIGTSVSATGAAASGCVAGSAASPTSSVGGSAAGGSAAAPSAAASTGAPPVRTPKWVRKAFLAARIHPLGLGPPAPRRWSIGNAALRLRMVRERRPWERRSRQSFRGGETAARRCPERSPGSLRGEMADFFTWVGRAAHSGHAARTLSREGNAATVTRRRRIRPQWYQGAGMNGSALEKNRDLALSI